MPVAECEDYMTTIRHHYSDNMFTLAAVVLLRQWIGSECHNHGFMYPRETSDHLRQVLILCDPLSALIDNGEPFDYTAMRSQFTQKCRPFIADPLFLFRMFLNSFDARC